MWTWVESCEIQAVWVLGVGVGLLLFLWIQERSKKKDRWSEHSARLEEAVRSATLINSNFFHSLEMMQKRLESLLIRADGAEQKLRRLLTQAEVGRVDQYATASLLLSEGEEVEQVARVLRLPLAQVRLVQELRQEVEKKKPQPPVGKDAKKTNADLRMRIDKKKHQPSVGKESENGLSHC